MGTPRDAEACAGCKGSFDSANRFAKRESVYCAQDDKTVQSRLDGFAAEEVHEFDDQDDDDH